MIRLSNIFSLISGISNKRRMGRNKKKVFLSNGFTLCCGDIDSKHFFIKCPSGSCKEFFNYKGGYNIIMLALVDAELYVDVEL